jgi:hypothetical protein
MSIVAASQPGGKERINLAVLSNVPHTVGKSSESIVALMDLSEGSSLRKDMSWIMWNLVDPDFGMRPSGNVQNGPMILSSSSGVNASEYCPAACSAAM